jgi:hypothetical protein
MAHFSFTLQVTGIDPKKYETVLHRAGCDDALIAVVNGDMFLDFDREAPSYEKAVAAAVLTVEKAGGKVVKVDRA